MQEVPLLVVAPCITGSPSSLRVTPRNRYIESISGFTAVAGALVSEARGLVFTSNRGENTVSVFAPGAERESFKIAVGMKPNGLAFDADRGILIAQVLATPPCRIHTRCRL